MPIDEASIQALKAKHGEVYLLSAKTGEQIAVRVPNDGEWAAFIDQREKTGARALKALVLMTALHPGDTDVRKMIDARPGLSQIFGARIMEIAGMAEEAELKKA